MTKKTPDLPLNLNDFRFHADSNLHDFVTRAGDEFDDDDLKYERDKQHNRLRDLQERLYAERKQSVLLVLQAMDAAGKDSTIARLTSRINAQGCLIHSFKKPTKLEMEHDFLWRVHHRAPAQGEITVFNRSHYEDVLIVKVHDWASPEHIEQRYHHINNFEALLADRGTRVVKLMLNISPEYQLERFRNRLENPEKYWKFNPGDLEEREHWDEYMAAFDIAMQRTSLESSPWYVVPAENRRFRDVMVARLLADTIEAMNPQFPDPEFDIAGYPPDSLK